MKAFLKRLWKAFLSDSPSEPSPYQPPDIDM